VQLKKGIPTIACRDIEIQRRENDLVVATFGRGFYVLDDYTPLRDLSPESLEAPALVFPVKDAWHYIESGPLGGRRRASQGDGFYSADNPPFGAVFTYYLQEGRQTLKDDRRKRESELFEKGDPVYYPSWEELKIEDREHAPVMVFTIRDAGGSVVRRITGAASRGIHRVAWDLRYPASTPIVLSGDEADKPWGDGDSGPMVAPGGYSVTMAERVRGRATQLAGPVNFEVVAMNLNPLRADDPAALLAFAREANELQGKVAAAVIVARDTQTRLNHLRRAVLATPAAESEMLDRIRDLETDLRDLQLALEGNSVVSRRNEPVPPSIRGRVYRVVGGLNRTTMAPTQTMRENLAAARKEFDPVMRNLKGLVEIRLAGLEQELEQLGAPYTPGRLPSWD